MSLLTNGPFRVEEITRFVVRGPSDYCVTVNSIEEAQERARMLNGAYQKGYLIGKMEAAWKQP